MNGHRPMTSTSTTSTTSSRILTDVPCKVCHDNSSGKHYGIFACDGCAGFFKRSIRRNRQYVCKNHGLGNCPVDKTHRNQCRSCRLTRCLEAGMNKEAVQHERGPRNSTIRRQMALLLKESSDLITAYHHQQHYRHHPIPTNFHHPLDLRRTMVEPVGHHPPSIGPHPVDTQESAARILFNAINWTKTVPAFLSLSTDDQLSLLEEAWHDLFLLTAAEQHLIFDERTSAVKQSDITAIRTLLQTCQQLQIDPNEYICLKSLVLFRTSRSSSSILYLQEQAKILLNTYIIKQYPSQPHRFSKLIQLLTSFRSISSLTIEDLFFRQTIGEQTHMEQLVKDMYQINMAAMVAQASI